MATEEINTIEEQSDFFFGKKKLESYVSTLQKGLDELKELESKNLTQNQAFPLLLSRYHSGQLENQGSMVRIKKFLKAYLRHDRRDTQTLLLFRNAVAHSVSLFAFDASSKREVRFRLTNEGPLILQETQVRFAINTNELFYRLNESIEAYHTEVLTSIELQKRFQKVFKKLGYIQ
jgi:hypothetical protein